MTSMNQQMFLASSPVGHKLKVFRKDGYSDAEFKVYHLEGGAGGGLFSYEDESAIFLKGRKNIVPAAQIDSVVSEKGVRGFPVKEGIAFEDIKGAINTFSSDPNPSEDYEYLQKGDSKIHRYDIRFLENLVQDDEEANGYMRKYDNRGYWKYGTSGGGVVLFLIGSAIYIAQTHKDENGKIKGSSPLGMSIAFTGMAAALLPAIGWLDFIWKDDPLNAIRAYNRNKANP